MNLDDPKLTAFALDELDSTERADLERLLAEDPAARAEIEATRAFAAKLRHQLQSESAEPLTRSQREEVAREAAGGTGSSAPAKILPFWRRPGVFSAIAAALLVAATIPTLFVQLTPDRPARPRAEERVAVPGKLPAEQPPATEAGSEGFGVKLSDAERPHAELEFGIAPAGSVPGPAPKDKALSPSPTQGAVFYNNEAKQDDSTAVVRERLKSTSTDEDSVKRDSRAAASTAEVDQLAAASVANQQASPSPVPKLQLSKEVRDSDKALAPQNEAASLLGGSSGTSDRADIALGMRGLSVSTERSLSQTETGKPQVAEAITAAAASPAAKDTPLQLTPPAPTTPSPAPAAPSSATAAFPVELKSEALTLDAMPEARVPAPDATIPHAPLQRRVVPMPSQPGRPNPWFREEAERRPDEALNRRLAERGLERRFEAELQNRYSLYVQPEKPADRGGEAYEPIVENEFARVADQPLSTFSVDVDTASYTNVRRYLNSNRLPPRDAVRIEELINYFSYDYPAPAAETPFSVNMEVASCPWTPGHRLLRVGLKGRRVAPEQRPSCNLVFLIDVSGSMQPANRLPLVKQSLGLLVDQLHPSDRVGIVVYAGASGCVLDSTGDKAEIRRALAKLDAGGSTNGGAGIELAYTLAEKHFIKGGTNRVILATDGDFNVGITDRDKLVQLIERKARGGVFLTVLGYGMDNLKDATLEQLADKGNGNYAYIDTLAEGRRMLVEQLDATLMTIAKDVKVQIEFNPAQVSAYRLIGYENRALRNEEFNDDRKDAGEIGAGHSVTALYEVAPAGVEQPRSSSVDSLKYRPLAAEKPPTVGQPDSPISKEMLTLKLRYKEPAGDTSKLLEFPLVDQQARWEQSSRDFRFAASVASFGMLLRDSRHRGSATWDSTLEVAQEGKGEDRDGYRAEFIGLVEKARALSR